AEKAEAARKAAAEKAAAEKAEAARKAAAEKAAAEKAEAARKAAAEKAAAEKAEAVRKAAAEKAAAEKAAAEKAAAAKAEAERVAVAKAAAEQAALAKAKADAEAARAARAAAGDQAINAIKTKVNHSWIRSPTAAAGMRCTIQVRLTSGGQVIGEPVVIASSGDEMFDNSAVNAVLKAQPLPVPTDRELFNKEFRSFTFTFEPRG
ncbi:cell envelope integrity protein TolA, partial [Methylobacter sp. BlB1]|uniref:cell envelope integrity protein TolA n=1 Tax=Methylobacter sp. BlB1 TaxID=2785914 RepID=UPI001893C84B